MKQKYYQYINFTKCETSYLQEIYNNIFAFLLGSASNKIKMEKNEKETHILLNMYINFTECKTRYLQEIYKNIFMFVLTGQLTKFII